MHFPVLSAAITKHTRVNERSSLAKSSNGLSKQALLLTRFSVPFQVSTRLGVVKLTSRRKRQLDNLEIVAPRLRSPFITSTIYCYMHKYPSSMHPIRRFRSQPLSGSAIKVFASGTVRTWRPGTMLAQACIPTPVVTSLRSGMALRHTGERLEFD
jgi:hypothetical protein